MQQSRPIVVRGYRGRKREAVTEAYEEDAELMVAAGYKPVREAWSGGGMNPRRTLFFGLLVGALAPDDVELHVTYEAGPGAGAVPEQALAPGRMSEQRSRVFWTIVLILVALAVLLAVAAIVFAKPT